VLSAPEKIQRLIFSDANVSINASLNVRTSYRLNQPAWLQRRAPITQSRKMASSFRMAAC
jgi:hypothetical protein